jgi:membrane protein implicated in regulation of membrane protease activity
MFSYFSYLVLDASLAGMILPFYPISNFSIGFSLVSYFPEEFAGIFFPSLDAALLVLWLIYIDWRHKISNFI